MQGKLAWYLFIFWPTKFFVAVELQNFWECMVQQLQKSLPGIKPSLYNGKAAFNNILASWQGKPIMLAIDEFDKVLNDDSICLELLDGLRAIKGELRQCGTKTGYNVQSVIIISPISVIKAATETNNKTILSPFNVSDTISSSTFTL